MNKPQLDAADPSLRLPPEHAPTPGAVRKSRHQRRRNVTGQPSHCEDCELKTRVQDTALELGKARSRMEALADEAQTASHRKDEFLAMLAHELRNPLAGLSTALGLLQRPGADLGRTERLHQLCRHQVDALARLVDDLLDVCRITRGKIALHKLPAELTAIVQHAVQVTQARLDERRLSLALSISGGPFRLNCDRLRLEQVITNLLANAIKYTPEGGRIEIQLQREDCAQPHAILRVRDSGRGIPASVLPHIFDLFVQADCTLDRAGGGLGIGLTLARSLVEMHGGSIYAESGGRNAGSTFIARLPLADDLPPPLPTTNPILARGKRRRILLIEDNEAVRITLCELLQELGHTVQTACDGSEGLRRLIDSPPEIAIVDIGLPELDGFELARRARASAGGKRLRLIALSGYSGPDIQRQAHEAGFDRQLVKPVKLPELSAILTGDDEPIPTESTT